MHFYFFVRAWSKSIKGASKKTSKKFQIEIAQRKQIGRENSSAVMARMI